MFHYYGSKQKIVSLYPAPKFNTIIEPFAGAANYSLKYYKNNVILNDKDKTISDIWKFILGANKEKIIQYANFNVNDDIRNLDIEQAHKDLIGFCINRGSSTPCNIVQKWSCQVKSKPNWASTTFFKLNKIAENLERIRHFKITNLDYTEIENIEASWFIDPPYQSGGQYYKYNKIDYNALAEWCLNRRGEVIVCENSKANWLPFKPLKTIYGQKNSTTEAIFYQCKNS